MLTLWILIIGFKNVGGTVSLRQIRTAGCNPLRRLPRAARPICRHLGFSLTLNRKISEGARSRTNPLAGTIECPITAIQVTAGGRHARFNARRMPCRRSLPELERRPLPHRRLRGGRWSLYLAKSGAA